jgi:HSP20 family molecular chaperone IbpA
MTNYKTTTTRFNMPAELNQFLIGMDSMFDDAFACQSQKYPPHSIYEVDNEICIEMAVAGFKKSELKIHLSPDNMLIVNGEKEVKDTKEYIHRGLSSRAFEKKFALNRDLEVKNSTCEDGILKIFIKNIPHKDDKVINID